MGMTNNHGKIEVKTDLWVAEQLKECNIDYSPQGGDVHEIDVALSSASKRGTGNAGYPEFVSVINDSVLVVEDKADTDKHCKYTESGIIDTSTRGRCISLYEHIC